MRSSILLLIVMFGALLPSHIIAGSTNRENSGNQKLTVTTVRVTEIKSNQAKCSLTVQGAPVTEKGVCWSDAPSPTINMKKSAAPSNPANSGSAIMSGLKATTKYYVRAYAKSGSEVYYGNELNFTTLEEGKNSNQNVGKKVEPKPESNKK